ncbi:MAG: trigger factor [Gammaproteobacteria bacterium]
MEISIKELEGLKRCMTVVLPVARVDEAVEVQLKKLMQTVKLKGFRTGKVPYKVVKQQFGDSVFHDVTHDLVKSTLPEALSKQPFTVAGRPHIEVKQHKPHEPLTYEATFEIYPQIELRDLRGAKIEKLKSEIAQEDVDKVLEKLRQRATQWREVARAAQSGDRVIIDFEGTRDGNKIEGGAAKDFALVLGSKMMIPGFEDALLGSMAGNEVNTELTFPESYFHKDLAGKTVNFKIVIHKVEEPMLPEIDDEFAKGLGITEGGIESLKKEIHQNMTREVTQLILNDLKRKVWDEWLRVNSFEIPQVLVELEIERLQRQLKQQLAARSGTQQQIPDLPRAQFEEEAKRRVRLGLLLNEFVKHQQLKADPEQLDSKINEIAAAYDHPQEVAKWIRQNKEQLAEVEAMLLEEQAVGKLLENADVHEKFIPCQELIKLGGEEPRLSQEVEQA